MEVSGNPFYGGLPDGRWFAPETFRIDVDLPDLGPGQSLIRSIPEPTSEGSLRWIDEVYVEPRITITDATAASSAQTAVFIAGALVGLAGGFFVEAALATLDELPKRRRRRREARRKK